MTRILWAFVFHVMMIIAQAATSAARFADMKARDNRGRFPS